MISVDEITIDTVSPKVWISFGWKLLTKADKRQNNALGKMVTDKHMNFLKKL